MSSRVPSLIEIWPPLPVLKICPTSISIGATFKEIQKLKDKALMRLSQSAHSMLASNQSTSDVLKTVIAS